MKKKFAIKFYNAHLSEELFWKQILWIEFYEWDETPYGLTIRILGVNFDFLIGKWEYEDDL